MRKDTRSLGVMHLDKLAAKYVHSGMANAQTGGIQFEHAVGLVFRE
jgi:hypothetical protein